MESEHDDDHLYGEPDLDDEGLPDFIEIRDGDNVQRVEIPQTKWDNCIEHAALDRPLVDSNVNGVESEDAGQPVLLNPFLSY